MTERVLKIDGALNFRDLGGYKTADNRTVKWRMLYRSAQLDRLSQQGVLELAELDVKTVVDLRFSDESSLYPTILEAVPNAEMLAWHDHQEAQSGEKSHRMIRSWRDSLDTKDPAQVREAMRVNYPQKLYSHRAIYQKMLESLCAENTPLLFHCAAGKDRTGVAAALILSLLGVDNQQIIEDYLITQTEIEGKMQAWMAAGLSTKDHHQDFQAKLARQPKELLEPIFAADRSYIETLLNYIEATYDGFDGYADQQLNFSSNSIAELKQTLLV